MTLADSAIPSSSAFDAIAAGLKNEVERKRAIQQGGAIFAFEIKGPSGETGSWYVDLKDSGTAGKGAAPEGKKADVTIAVSDADFNKLVSGQADAQKLFMGGKLKIRGNVMKATRLGPIFEGVRAKAKL